jgi:23S rRNA (pseudouridine1915-N3)-methyltransferase
LAGALRVVTVGRTRRGPLADLETDYHTRIGRFASITRASVTQSRKATPGERRRDEAARLGAHRADRGVFVALDERGRSVDSPTFGRLVSRWRERGEVVFAIGGPDGVDPPLVAASDHVLALGPLTLPHELALVVLLEQLYRALAAAKGHPYAGH